MQHRKLHFGFLPAAVSNKECADTAMAMTLICLLAVMFTSGIGCTNMSKTQQGVASGVALGALGGAGIAAIAGGSAGWGALAGAGVGALAGGIVCHEQSKGRGW